MKTARLFTTAAIALAVISSAAQAQTSAQQTVTFSVSAINQIAVSGNPAALNVTAAPAPGSPPSSVSNNLTTYSITTNETNKAITASLNSAMPNNTTLSVALAAPPLATTLGPVNLNATAQNDVTGISQLSAAGLTITYTLSDSPGAGTVASQNRTVTFTIITGT